MNQPPRLVSDADPNAITIEEARSLIHSRLQSHKGVETVHCKDALDRVLAVQIHSPLSVPSFRASAMDGYAIKSADSHATLQIAGYSLAGHPCNDKLANGHCVRITTGARVPDDADTVVQQENVVKDGNSIVITVAPSTGQHIRQVGSDSQQGQSLIQAHSRLGPAELALLSAHGVTQVDVLKPLSVAVFSTGDELVDPGQCLNSGQIFDANRPLIINLLKTAGLTIIDLGICQDSMAELESMFEQAKTADLVISSGGVSVGDADYVKQVLEQRGTVDLWKIAMKPGRPLSFGFSHEQQPFFGLPGNPVSAAITCLLFVIPAIKHMLGMQEPIAPPLRLPLTDTLYKNPGRVEYQRAIMSPDDLGNWQVSTTGLQDSHVLSSLHQANCLIELSVDSLGAEPGELVDVYPFTHFGTAAL